MTVKQIVALSTFCLGIAAQAYAAVPVYTKLVTFEGPNGAFPDAKFTPDAAGNLYGTTQVGGPNSAGTIYELSGSNHQTLTNLASLTGTSGESIATRVIFDAAGNLYGTTYYSDSNFDPGGTVYELSGPNHQTFTTLVNFNGTNGYGPQNLMIDAAGNIFGTTEQGGSSNMGTVFELSGPNHQTRTTLVNFSGSNGSFPGGPLTEDAAGNLYGTTYQGGTGKYGTVFKLSGPTHQALTTLVNFNGNNGAYPNTGLMADGAGNMYGVTTYGGASFNGSPFNLLYGTVYELSGPNDQTLTTLATFNQTNGSIPLGGVIMDSTGDLFGMTQEGGTSNDGTVFELSGSAHQNLTTLLTFSGANGNSPQDGLTADSTGNLYGTTSNGGDLTQNGVFGIGVAFELSNTGFTVPEPSSLLLLAISAIGVMNRRVRQRISLEHRGEGVQ